VSKAAYQYPPDEFDAPPDPDAPRGVHRAPRSAWSRWWPFVAVIVVVPLLAWGTVTVLAQRGQLKDLPGVPGASSSQEPSVTPTDTAGATPTATGPTSAPPVQATTPAAPAANFGVAIDVRNGAKINGLAAKVGGKLTAAGFTKVTAANTATANLPAVSTVFYGTDALASTAQLVASTIKVSAVVKSATQAPTGITVVLRTDPGA
jgi:hypothetical protein